MLTEPRIARANTGNSFLETIGISIAVGTVLGASTLPFYGSPGSNVSNVLYGASAGAAVGVGIWLVGLAKDTSLDKYNESSNQNQLFLSDRLVLSQNVCRLSSARPAAFWTPIVSLTW